MKIMLYNNCTLLFYISTNNRGIAGFRKAFKHNMAEELLLGEGLTQNSGGGEGVEVTGYMQP